MPAIDMETAPGAPGPLSLDGTWEFRFEEGKSLEEAADPAFAATDAMSVPGCFDTMPKWYLKRGTALYRRRFTLDRAVPAAWLVVDGMGLRGDFRIDGRPLGVHPFPYARLELAAGPLEAGEHELFAALDNRFDWETLKLARPYYDFYLHGGFYHGVSLSFDARKLRVRTRGIADGSVEIEAVGFGAEDFGATLLFDGRAEVPAAFRGGRAFVRVPGFRLWSPEAPNLHEVAVKAPGGGRPVARTRFGIRTVEAKGGRILLNGKPVFLRGANRHEAHPAFGAATPESLMVADLQLLKSLGANFVRGCHYQQSQRFLDLCDELGFLVWEESLGWGNGGKFAPENELLDETFAAQQLEQTRGMVRASFNHPSVVVFAFMNEFVSDSEPGRALAEKLAAAIRAEDSGRLVSFACCHNAGDVSHSVSDVVAFNTYPGWIGTDAGSPEHLRRIVAEDLDAIVSRFRSLHPGKPVMVSEMGACGVYGHHDGAAAQWTEEFQAEYDADVVEAAFANPEICGFALWQFADARSYLRGGATIRTKPFAENLAGVFDGYRRPKLAAEAVRRAFARPAANELSPGGALHV